MLHDTAKPVAILKHIPPKSVVKSRDLWPSGEASSSADDVGGKVINEEVVMIERVVVPVDFSSESDRALLIAPLFARWAGAGVELVTVAEPADRADIGARLAALAGGVGDNTSWRVVESGGPPEAALLRELHRDEKALWCIGSHARGAWSELLIDSVSEDLVRDAHVPVVLVGPHVTAQPSGRVLAVALDGTAESEVILPAAAALGGALGMTLRLLQVAGRGGDYFPSDSIETGYLARAAATMPSMRPQVADYDVIHGDHPGHVLADYVFAQPDIGLIALATRGLRGGARLLHRSTAFELAHRAVVPVLILHHV
jgi:nucleotide-binding universal stress UspA family protein